LTVIFFLLVIPLVARLERWLTPFQIKGQVINRLGAALAHTDFGSLLRLLEVEIILSVDPCGHLR
jgi:hypothetical protein